MTALAVQNQVPPVATERAELTPMEMLNRAVERGASVEVLEKLMSLQERWEANEARKNFDRAIAAARAEIKPVERNREGHNRKRYADFAAIAKAIDPILATHGLSYRFRTSQADKITVTCILFGHGHSEESTLSGPADTSGNKNAIQAIGSTLTYLQRYSLVQALGLAAAEDDDGNAGGNGDTITQEQADALRETLEANGKDRAKFLRWAKVERIEDISAAAYASCLEAASFKKAAQS